MKVLFGSSGDSQEAMDGHHCGRQNAIGTSCASRVRGVAVLLGEKTTWGIVVTAGLNDFRFTSNNGKGYRLYVDDGRISVQLVEKTALGVGGEDIMGFYNLCVPSSPPAALQTLHRRRTAR